MKNVVLAVVMSALTLSANAQERIYTNRGTASQKAALEPMIRDHKARTMEAQATLQPTAPALCPAPTEPCPQPTPVPPGVSVIGVVIDEDENTVTDAYVLVSWVTSSGGREHYPAVRTDSTGTFISRNETNEPPLETKMLVQVTSYAQVPGEEQFQVTEAEVEVTGALNDAGRITVKHQMGGFWIEAVASGNTVAIRVRKGNSFPGRDLLSSITVSTPARNSFYRTVTREQQPFRGRPMSTGIVSQTWGWNYFSIPDRAPKGGGMCGNVQVSSERDPSLIHNSGHGFCYNPAVRVLGTW